MHELVRKTRIQRRVLGLACELNYFAAVIKVNDKFRPHSLRLRDRIKLSVSDAVITSLANLQRPIHTRRLRAIAFTCFSIRFSRDKRLCEPPESRWSPPPTDARNFRGATGATGATSDLFDAKQQNHAVVNLAAARKSAGYTDEISHSQIMRTWCNSVRCCIPYSERESLYATVAHSPLQRPIPPLSDNPPIHRISYSYSRG
ncbi:hypothetical protein EVAR_90219_1 [Eumeta japonica]|uniref:Uncharacterized protein n=1 Tax=Eumeta variegata TaxID=151549 RepID=A0A4C1WYJ8_EUMVA|nr:hypothetical protein EVAR_90219_1 [Eumeta japonica]